MRLIERLYRVFLRAYPPSLRRDYGSQMASEAREMLHDARQKGTAARIVAVGKLSIDFLTSVPREWRRELAKKRRRPRSVIPKGLGADLKFAVRSYRRTAGVTALAIVTLTLGIGVSTALFGVVDAALLRALPYPNANELVMVWPDRLFSRAMFELTKTETRAFAGVTAYDGSVLTLVDGGEPTEVVASGVPPEHFAVVGITPAVGRTFVAEEHTPGSSPVAIISHEIWVDRFGADSSVIGRVVTLAGGGVFQRTIVGIMPNDYRALLFGSDVWIPIQFDRADADFEDSYVMTAVARLRPGVTLAMARSDLANITAQVQERWPGHFSDQDVTRATVVSLQTAVVGDAKPRLIVLSAAVGLMLFAACLNVANLLLARSRTRRVEIAVRAALGAARWRIMRQLMTEAMLLALVGGVLGVLAAGVMNDVLLLAVPGLAGVQPRIDLRFLGFASAVAVAAAFIGGVLPGWHASRADPGSSMRGTRGSPSKTVMRSQNLLIVVEVALATTLAFSAGLLTKSVRELAAVPTGFDAPDVITFRLTAPATSDTDSRVLRYFADVRNSLRETPGVQQVGLVSRLPMDGGISRITIFPEGYEPDGGPLPSATHRLISPGFFETLGVRIVEGRDVTEAEMLNGPLKGVVNEALANRFWPNTSAIGKRFFGRGGVVWLEIVGVVADVRDDGPTGSLNPTVYVPQRDWVWRTMSVAIRPTDRNSVSIEQLKRATWRVDAGVPITRVRTVGDIVDHAVRNERLLALMSAMFAAFAVLLSAVGVTGVVGHAVADRRREFGIRTAIGASAPRLLRAELYRIGRVLATGIVLGVSGSLAAGQLLRSLVFVDTPYDLTMLGAVVIGLTLLALFAAYLPARRGTRVDAMDFLRL